MFYSRELGMRTLSFLVSVGRSLVCEEVCVGPLGPPLLAAGLSAYGKA